MLPRGRHRVLVDSESGEVIDDLLDTELWKRMRWSLADPRQEPMLRILLPAVADAADLARRFILDTLPRIYTPEIYERRCERTYQHAYESYFGDGRSVYGSAA